MIITKIRLQEEHALLVSGVPYPLPFVDLELNPNAGDNGYMLMDVSGLAPPILTPIVDGFDSAGIPVFDNQAANKDLAFKIELKPGIGQTYGSLRDNLYKFVSRSLCISLMNGSTVVAQTTGSINQFEASLFSNKPSVVFNVSCNTAEFYSPVSVSIPVSELNTAQPKIPYEMGSAPTGLDLQFTVNSSRSSFSFSNYGKYWYSGTTPISTLFQVTYPLVSGDVITIKTYRREKKINLLRASVNYDLIGYINSGAVWPKLFSGLNIFDWDILAAWATINSASYVPRYWGV